MLAKETQTNICTTRGIDALVAVRELRSEVMALLGPGANGYQISVIQESIQGFVEAIIALHSGKDNRRGVELQQLEDSLRRIIGRPNLPERLRFRLQGLQFDLIEFRVASLQAVEGESQTLDISTSLLYQVRRGIFPSERMVVGAVRTSADARTLEAVYDVTGRATEGHVEADVDKLTAALLDMDATGAFFGFWGHSHPGSSVACTIPSLEDKSSYEDRLVSGDSPYLIGAIFAGAFVRFFKGGKHVRLIGSGLRRTGDIGEVYEFTGN